MNHCEIIVIDSENVSKNVLPKNVPEIVPVPLTKIAICMTGPGHPEDQLTGKTLVYGGQERCKKNDVIIPQATFLLYRNETTGRDEGYDVEFSRQLRVRNEPDPRNLGVLTYRPLFEFRVLGPAIERPLPARYEMCLEKKVASLLRYSLLCNHDSVNKGILPCTVIMGLPSLYDRRILKWWKKAELIKKVLEHSDHPEHIKNGDHMLRTVLP